MDSNGLNFRMLTQFTDWLPPWRARTAYIAGQGLVDPNGNIQLVQTGGQSDAAQPVWKTSVGQTTADGSITWVNSGASLGSWQTAPDGTMTWTAVGPGSWQANTAFAVGQYITDANGNLQLVSAVTGKATTGAAPPVWLLTIGQTVTDGNVSWTCAGPSQAGLDYCSQSKRLHLRSMRTGKPPQESFGAAITMLEDVPITLDQFGTYARWDQGSGIIYAGGAIPANSPYPNEVPILVPPQHTVTDLAMGYDGILYIAIGGSLLMTDRRNRWPDFTLTVPDFNFWRLGALPEGGVLALDQKGNQLGKVAGQPLQTGPVDVPNPGILRSCQTNPNPPQIVSRYALPAGEFYVGLAPLDPTQATVQYVVLSWGSNSPSNQVSRIRIFNEVTFTGTTLQLQGANFPYAIGGLGSSKLAAFVTNYNEALIYDLSNAGDVLVPAGETYVVRTDANGNAGLFVHGFSLPPNYANVATASPVILPLVPLSLNSLAPSGATFPGGPAVVDSGTAQAIWHRMFIEASIPPRCGAIVWLAASDNQADLFNSATKWFPHLAGSATLTSIPTDVLADAPSMVWQSIPTEIPFGPTLLGEDPVQNTVGLFMTLIQRANRKVRNLTGRYLGIRIQLNGDGRNTPEIAALRVYASRFSYVKNYLPEIYRENQSGAAGDKAGPSTRHDFFERFVDLFESQFTRIEDRVANSYLLTRAECTPDASLPWLGSWIGIEPDSYPPGELRARIEATPYLYKWRGTALGITRALDVATGGLATSGAIIVIENYRLRHIFATILGADLSIKNNPLLPGYSASSNSIVGDTLFLGDPRIQAELQALYESNLNIPGSSQAVQSFYDQFANRITVFIHNHVQSVNLNLVNAIVEEEKPAHVLASVLIASQPLMIGLASLLGVNTYLGPDPPRNNARVGVSDVGRFDIVTHSPALDPRLGNGSADVVYSKPIARIKAPRAVKPGDPIVLDGSASSASPGSEIVQYAWTQVQPQS